MSKRVSAMFGNTKVEVAMLSGNYALTIFEYIKPSIASMRVVGIIPRQEYLIDEDSGMIVLHQNNNITSDTRTLSIKPLPFDEVTRGQWD